MTLIVAPSPHWHAGSSIRRLMADVLLALLPAVAWAGLCFGYRAWLVVAVCVAAALVAETACQAAMKRPVAVFDLSAAVTGALLAATLPANIPLWFAALGAVFAIAIGKQAFGGLGGNVWNPALLARAAMHASMPQWMISNKWPWRPFAVGEGPWALKNLARPFSGSFESLNAEATRAAASAASLADAVTSASGAAGADIATSATLLARLQHPALEPGAGASGLPGVLEPGREILLSAWVGLEGGSLGEVSALLLAAGGLYLLFRKAISWHIPLAFIGMAGLCVFALPVPVTMAGETGAEAETVYRWAGSLPLLLAHWGGGGLMLGAFFMATDCVTGPLTKKGKLWFGAGCGLMTMLIRLYGVYPEGVCYAILLMNTATPLIDRFTRPRVFGTGKRRS